MISHNASSKVYVGQTVDLRKRIYQHKIKPNHKMKKDVRAAAAAGEAWEEAFTVTVLATSQRKWWADKKEQHYIRHFQAQHNGNYNTLSGRPGDSSFFWYASKEGML